MTKALLKKEFLQIKRLYTTNRRKNKQGGRGMFIFLIVIYFVLMLAFGALDSLFAINLIPTGNGWLYYFFITVLAFVFGLIGSVFTTAEMLFRAKDNEILLAMPIPPSTIIFSRMVSVYIMGLIYELLIMLPGVVLYFIFAGITIVTFLFGILGIVILGFVILTFSCLFGWIVAIVMAKLKNKNILTVIISVIFIGLFIYIRFRADAFFRLVIENAGAIGEKIRGWGYPLYSLGLGMDGNVVAMLVSAAIAGVLFGVTYWIISKSFNRIINIKPSEKKAQFKTGQIRTSGVNKALFSKEFHRFTSSPNYMLNCGLGILFLIAAAIISLIMSGQIRDIMAQITGSIYNGKELAAVIITFAVCVLTGFIDISSPSISLEGSYLWILQAMPVTAIQVIGAKFRLAALFTVVPAVICAVVVQAVTGAGIITVILSAVLVAAYAVFTVLLGLRMDLRRPFLDWTNENQPVKQNMAVFFTMIIAMLCPIIPGVIYLAAGAVMGAEIYIAIWIIIFALLSLLLYRWLKTKGAEKFAVLGK